MKIIWSDWIIVVSMSHLPRQWDDVVPLDVVGAPTDWDWTLNIQAGTALDVIPLGVTDGIVGTTLTKNQLGLAGEYRIQLVGVKDGVTRHTNLTRFFVPESLSGASNWPDLPTVFSEAVDRAEDAADRAESAATHGPRISGTNTWEVWDPDKGRYVDTMVDASGAKGPQGPAGDPGKDGQTPDIGEDGNWYIGGVDTGKPSRGETGPRGPAGKDGTTDISLGLTSATVGQIAKITVVDADGKPTAWEPVDMPSGGDNEEWEFIVEATCEEDTVSFVVDKDADGRPFQLKAVAVITYSPAFTEDKTATGRGIGLLPNTLWGFGQIGPIREAPMSSKNEIACYDLHYFRMYEGSMRLVSHWSSQNFTNVRGVMMPITSAGNAPIFFQLDATDPFKLASEEYSGPATCIKIAGYSNTAVSAGTKIKAWGVRA